MTTCKTCPSRFTTSGRAANCCRARTQTSASCDAGCRTAWSCWWETPSPSCSAWQSCSRGVRPSPSCSSSVRFRCSYSGHVFGTDLPDCRELPRTSGATLQLLSRNRFTGFACCGHSVAVTTRCHGSPKAQRKGETSRSPKATLEPRSVFGWSGFLILRWRLACWPGCGSRAKAT